MNMTSNRRLLLACGVGLIAGLMAASAVAQTWETRVRFSLDTQLQIPGAVLSPGNYVMRVLNQTTNKCCVQFLNAGEDEIIATVPTVLIGRLNAIDESRFTVYERPRGLPQVLRTFYLPEKFAGFSLVYSDTEQARLTQYPVRHLPSLALLGKERVRTAGPGSDRP